MIIEFLAHMHITGDVSLLATPECQLFAPKLLREISRVY